MSIEVISKVLKLNVRPSSCKFVLVALANCANDENHECYPSVKYLCDATSQDRKTVLENIKRLREFGYIQDTGKRKGVTGQISVYKIIVNPAKKTDNSPENGTVPFFPSNSTVFPVKEDRFSVETVPKAGHGIVNESSIESSMNRKYEKRAPAPVEPKQKKENVGLGVEYLVSKGVSKKVAQDWLTVRAGKGAKTLTETGWDAVEREALKVGVSVDEAVRVCVEANWVGFNAKWYQNREGGGVSKVSANPASQHTGNSRHFGLNDKNYTAGTNAFGQLI